MIPVPTQAEHFVGKLTKPAYFYHERDKQLIVMVETAQFNAITVLANIPADESEDAAWGRRTQRRIADLLDQHKFRYGTEVTCLLVIRKYWGEDL